MDRKSCFMFVVVTKRGTPILDTLRAKRVDSIQTFCDLAYIWSDAYKLGFRCIKVEVEISPYNFKDMPQFK